MPHTTAPIGLPALEARLREDLQWLDLPAQPWVKPRHQEGQLLLEVAVIGGGMAGLALATELRHLGVKAVVFDQSEEGFEGPWATTARMQTLRSPKHLVGPALGQPSLTFRAWYEAQFGRDGWDALDRIPRTQWQDYLNWATEAFRLCASGVRDETQIHTHMCYSEFNDVIESIAAMDADVITIETSRSDMELLDAFEAFAYPNDIGPGVYDIHSPRVPDASEMANLLRKAAQRIPAERLWVNPDCGLKTRAWPETEAALIHMVAAARQLRAELA